MDWILSALFSAIVLMVLFWIVKSVGDDKKAMREEGRRRASKVFEED
jgi:uncharacterized membrane protein